jgi:hypothetical protein
MSSLACNGLSVVEGRVTLPRVGVWVANLDIVADDDDPLAGAVEITDDGIGYFGTVLRSSAVSGSCRALVVGGAGGFSKLVDARSYQRATGKTIVADLLAAVGERLDASATHAKLSEVLPYWTRGTVRAGSALASIVEALGLTWRVLPSGATWVGEDAFTKQADAEAHLELDQDGSAGLVELAPDAAILQPGMVLKGRRVGRVEHLVTREKSLRTTFWIAE